MTTLPEAPRPTSPRPPEPRGKVVVPGGSGHLGRLVVPFLRSRGYAVVVLARHPVGPDQVGWDGRTLGPWTAELEGAAAVLNLAGRSVNCRYSPANLKEMLDSRVESTRVLGTAIARAARPPRVWLQSSTATIYAHTFGPANDDRTGRIGGGEPDAPAYWKKSIDIATAWERTLDEAPTPATRKVALRSAMVQWPGRGGPFEVLWRLTRLGLGGALAGGRQYVSWIHGIDFARAVLWLLERSALAGPVNLAAPGPLPQAEFARQLRAAARTRLALPATAAMLELGAFLLRTDTELVRKSRRVVPRRLTDDGFAFRFPTWGAAVHDLAARMRGEGEPFPRGDGLGVVPRA